MGIISRHSASPYLDGEAPDGTDDIEVDLDRMFDLMNGGLDNANFASDAEINAAKLGALSVTGAKFALNTITHNSCEANVFAEAQDHPGLNSQKTLSDVAWQEIRSVTLSDPQDDGVRLILCSGILRNSLTVWPSQGYAKFRITRDGTELGGEFDDIWYGSNTDDSENVCIAYLDTASVSPGSVKWAWEGRDQESPSLSPAVTNLSMVVIDLKR